MELIIDAPGPGASIEQLRTFLEKMEGLRRRTTNADDLASIRTATEMAEQWLAAKESGLWS